MIRVVLIGDAGARRDALQASLEAASMEVRGVPYLLDPEDILSRWPVEVAIVDAQSDAEHALSMATRLRVGSGIGIVMLVGETQRRERLLALSLGVDHCFIDPVDLEELVLSVRNLRRRIGPADTVASLPVQTTPRAVAVDTAKEWCFDPAHWRLITPRGAHVPLSLAEYHLLRQLFLQHGNVVTRHDLLRGLDRGKAEITSRNLDMIVSRLRKKVERSSGERLPLQSARSIGYVFTGRCSMLEDGRNARGR